MIRDLRQMNVHSYRTWIWIDPLFMMQTSKGDRFVCCCWNWDSVLYSCQLGYYHNISRKENLTVFLQEKLVLRYPICSYMEPEIGSPNIGKCRGDMWLLGNYRLRTKSRICGSRNMTSCFNSTYVRWMYTYLDVTLNRSLFLIQMLQEVITLWPAAEIIG